MFEHTYIVTHPTTDPHGFLERRKRNRSAFIEWYLNTLDGGSLLTPCLLGGLHSVIELICRLNLL